MPYEIDGVTLLNVIGPDTASQVFVIVCCSIALFLAAAAIGILIWLIKNAPSAALIVLLIFITICALALGIGGLCGVDDEIKHPEEHSKYEVLIEDDASFKEITEYYEIDSTKGKIYVLKPKK